jgi:hypothetical protein
MASITVTYTLQPPAGIAAPTDSPAQLERPITLPTQSSSDTTSTQGETKTYYSSLSSAVLEAQATLNQHLTAWKDAIGDAEKAKEDMGKVGFGKGKAARMMLASKAAEAQVDGEDDEDEDED